MKKPLTKIILTKECSNMKQDKVVNQYGKIIDGKERLKILHAYDIFLDEVVLETGKVKIISVVEKEKEVIYNVEVTVF